MKKNVQFTHVAMGSAKNVAIAHIFKQDKPTEIFEYAVVRYPDLDPESKWYGTWSHSLGYFKNYEDAVKKFNSYIKE